MDHQSLPDSDLEKLLRQQLQQVDAQPDDNTWQQIALRQKPQNTWLRLRHYGAWIAPMLTVLLIAGLAWWRYAEQPATAPGQQVEPGSPSALPNAEIPVANIPPTAAPISDGKASNQKSHSSLQTGQRFGSRPNTVPASSVRFQADQGVRYQNPVSGSSVFIPANSLTTADGRPVTGEVELKFREYRSFADFLAAGIPMHYADSRGAFFFNSGGMFEVRVSQGDESLQMAAGQSYEVNFVPTDRLTKPSLYYYDENRPVSASTERAYLPGDEANDGTRTESSGAWQYQPDSAFASAHGLPVQKLPAIVTEDVAVRDNKNGKGVNCLPIMLAKVPAQPAKFVAEGISTGFDLASGKMKMPAWFRNRPEMTLTQMMNLLERGHIRIRRDVDKVEQLFPEDADNVFTELKAFKNCYFIRRLDSVQNIQTDQKLDREQHWESIVIYKDKGNTCHITLYSANDMLKFYADLLPSMGSKRFDVDKVLAEYQRLRTIRLDNAEATYKKLTIFMALAPAFQTQQEWCMTQADWLAYFEYNQGLMYDRYNNLMRAGNTTNEKVAFATWKTWYNRLLDLHFEKGENARPSDSKRGRLSNLAYALRLTRFGVYNCDQIFRLAGNSGPQYVYANYRTADGRSIDPVSATLIEREGRLFLSLPRTNALLRAPGRSIDVVLTDAHGHTYHLGMEAYKEAMLHTDTVTLNVEDITDETRSPRDWARVLNL